MEVVGDDIEWDVDGIAGGAWERADDDARGLGEGVEDGGFADVRSADDGEFEWRGGG